MDGRSGGAKAAPGVAPPDRGARRGSGAPEAARAPAHPEPALAAAVRAVDAPAVGELAEESQAEALGLDRRRIEAGALVGDLHPREVLAQPREEDDALVAAQAGVADGVCDDLGGEQRDGVLDVLVQPVAGERAAGQARGLGPRLE